MWILIRQNLSSNYHLKVIDENTLGTFTSRELRASAAVVNILQYRHISQI